MSNFIVTTNDLTVIKSGHLIYEIGDRIQIQVENNGQIILFSIAVHLTNKKNEITLTRGTINIINIFFPAAKKNGWFKKTYLATRNGENYYLEGFIQILDGETCLFTYNILKGIRNG